MPSGRELDDARAPTGGLWPRRPDRADLGALGGFVALTVLLFRTAWMSPTTTWVGHAGDPPLFMWFLRWTPFAVGRGHNPFFSDYINYPDGVNLMWNTSMPLPTLLLSPLTLTAGPVVAYNVLVTLAVALSAWAAYLMLRRYVGSRWAAVVGGLLYGFSPYVLGHAAEHPNLPAAFIPPLMFVLLDEILVRQRRSAVTMGLWLGGLAFVQLMVSEELLATQFIVAGVALVLLMVLFRSEVRPRIRHAATALAVAMALSLALAAVPLSVQFLGPQRVLSGSLWGPEIFVTDVYGFVIPTEGQEVSPEWAKEFVNDFTDACCPAELGAYLGLPLLLLMVLATVRFWAQPLVRFAGLLAGIVALLSMGPHLHVRGVITRVALPFQLLTDVPVMRNILATRFMLYVYLLAALLLAVVVDRLVRGAGTGTVRSEGPLGASTVRSEGPLGPCTTRSEGPLGPCTTRSEGPLGPLAAALLAVVVLVPLVPALDFPSTRGDVPSFFASSDVTRIPNGSVALVAPFARDTNTSAPMLWQATADMRFRMPSSYALGPDVNGNFSYLPIPTDLSRAMEHIQLGNGAPVLDQETRRVFAAELAAKDVRSVIVGPMGYREAMVVFFQELLRRPPEKVGGVELWLQVDPATLA